MKKFALIAGLLFSVSAFSQKFDGMALTPPMGWNSWNKFACNVDEKLIRGVADAMVSSGMKDAGYQYIVIDDCWHGSRDSLGFIHPDLQRFPSGIKALADYIHSKGLKFGIYSDAGWQTCGGRPGSRGYEFQDAQTYAKWHHRIDDSRRIGVPVVPRAARARNIEWSQSRGPRLSQLGRSSCRSFASSLRCNHTARTLLQGQECRDGFCYLEPRDSFA